MRINLKVPFAQKEAAKELGARWDAARKIWYIIDPACLALFSDWRPEPDVGPAATGAAQTAAKPALRAKAVSSPGVLTGPTRVHPLCTCAVQPWDACPHSAT